MKPLRVVVAVFAALAAGSACAQERLSLELKPERPMIDAEKLPAPSPSPAASGAKEKVTATEVTSSREASFDEKARKAIFEGDVKVVDPEFNMTSDRLTVFLKRSAVEKGGGPGNGAKAKNAKEGEEAKAEKASDGAKEAPAGNGPPKKDAGAIDRAIAEGSVVFVRESTDEKGEVTRSVGKAARAEFEGATGDVTLSGWPQVQQGINTHVSAEESTVMVLNRDGRMKTRGRSKTVIKEEAGTERAGS
jgi:lipopolysaccharide export system protein LptA